MIMLLYADHNYFLIKFPHFIPTNIIQVLGCVVLTLVNVGGFIHFWGLTIDTVSCTNIIISIGNTLSIKDHKSIMYTFAI